MAANRWKTDTALGNEHAVGLHHARPFEEREHGLEHQAIVRGHRTGEPFGIAGARLPERGMGERQQRIGAGARACPTR